MPREVSNPGKWVPERNSPKLRGADPAQIEHRLQPRSTILFPIVIRYPLLYTVQSKVDYITDWSHWAKTDIWLHQ